MTHWLHPDAEAELGEAAVYYAKHASLAIAEAFLAEFERVRDLLIENQYRGPHGDDGLRCSTSTAFRIRLFASQMIKLGHKSKQWRINMEHLATGSAAYSQPPNIQFQQGANSRLRRL